jgi:adenylate kinase family enzyme
MQRVLVIGSGGAGKSTFAARLSRARGLPLVHLDALYWQPGWVEPSKAEWQQRVAQLVAEDRWVMDGNYGGTLEQRLRACDTVVFLDLPRVVCVTRVLRRYLRYRGHSRPDMTPGCPERLSFEFLNWIWSYPATRRPKILSRLSALAVGQRAVVLHSDAEVNAFIDGDHSDRDSDGA